MPTDRRWSERNPCFHSPSRFHLSLLFLIQLLLFFQGPRSAGESKPPKDLEEAQNWFQHDWEAVGAHDIRFQMNEGTVTWKDKNGQVGGFNLGDVISVVLAREPSSKAWRVTISLYDGRWYYLQNLKRERMERWEQAVRFLVQQAIQNVEASSASAFDNFKPHAEAWRTLTVKPKMPDDAYSHKVLAEDAYQNKNLTKAEAEYELALKSFPTWPEGQFNAALIAGELKNYRYAVLHMKEYLALVPDAPDAQAAKDKIIIWQDRTTHP